MFSPDGKQVLTGSFDGTARLWETSSGKLLSTFAGHTDKVWSVAFSPDGQQVLTGSYDRTARLWETSSGKLLFTFAGHTGFVFSVAFSPDGNYVITADRNGRVFFWSNREPNQRKLLGLYSAAYEVGAISWQDAKHLVLADKGLPQGRPHFYHLQLAGDW